MIQASVCIATFQRPEGLQRLLRSLTEQIAAPTFEVVVVDNDLQETGRPVAERFVDRLTLTYCTESVPGVAAVRNRAVAASRGTFLAFIDDDEQAAPSWLATLHEVMSDTDADGVFGLVANEFDTDVPDHIRACGLFDPAPFADRCDLPWWGTGTANAYIRRAALPDPAKPFDLRYGITGGEDTHLFKAMMDRGSRLIWSTAAVTLAHYPSSRVTLSWVVRRAMRYGGTGAEVEWLGLPLRRKIKLGRRYAFRAIRGSVLAAVFWRTDPTRATRALVAGAMAAGRTMRLLGYRVRIYYHPR